MAFTAGVFWQVQTDGSDTFAGGFDTGVAGFPTDGAATLANTAAPVFTSASYNFVAGDVGHWIYIKSGTNWTPSWYKIVSVAANAATLNATIGSAVINSPASGAVLTPSTVVGCATVASPTGATWGIDYSQGASARIAFTDMVIGGTTTQFTSAANPVDKNMVGNIINIVSGTGFTVQRVAIISTSGTTATCDKSLGTGGSTGGTGNLGGAMASQALPFSVAIASNGVYVKSGAYTATTTSTNVAIGCISSTVKLHAEGYGTVRGDRGTAPVLTASGIATAVLYTISGNGIFVNLTANGASLSSIRGFSLTSSLGYLLSAQNCTNNGFLLSSSTLTQCKGTGCATAPAFQGGNHIACEAYSNTTTGFNAITSAWHCLSYANSGASSSGFNINNSGLAVNCVAYGNGLDGFNLASVDAISLINCIAESNAGSGYSGPRANLIVNCAAYLNGTNFGVSAPTFFVNPITLTASAFVAAASANFALNAIAGGGALLRAAGIPGVTPDGLSTGYLDVGAIQSKALATLGIGWEGGFAT